MSANHWLGLAAAVTLIPGLLFIIDYGRKRWWTSVEGRLMFGQTFLIVITMIGFFVGRFTGGLGVEVWTIIISCFAVAQWTLYLQYRKIQRESRKI